ncbi:hypothetical protein FQR65_LT15716 [Abscondita terminalis]|nr:hypothetical protein FQR65_LT15716 [Abscondita terminalis]
MSMTTRSMSKKQDKEIDDTMEEESEEIQETMEGESVETTEVEETPVTSQFDFKMLIELMKKNTEEVKKSMDGINNKFDDMNDKIDQMNETLKKQFEEQLMINKVEIKTEIQRIEEDVSEFKNITEHKFEVLENIVENNSKDMQERFYDFEAKSYTNINQQTRDLDGKISRVYNELGTRIEEVKEQRQEKGVGVNTGEAILRLDELIRINHNEVPTFTGNIFDSPMLFLEKLERQFNTNMSDEKKLRMAEKALKGEAETWFQWIRGECENYEEFKKVFTKNYWDISQQEKVKQQMQKQKFDPTRSNKREIFMIRQYNCAKYFTQKGTEEELVEWLARQFEEQIYANVGLQNIVTIKNLQTYLRRCDQYTVNAHERKPQFLQQRQRATFNERPQQNRFNTENRQKYSNWRTENRDGSNLRNNNYFRGRGRGRFTHTRDRTQVNNYRVRKMDEENRLPQERKREEEVRNEDENDTDGTQNFINPKEFLEIERNKEESAEINLPFININIQGTIIKALLDTGAEISLISESIINNNKKLKDQIIRIKKAEIISANNKKMSTVNKMLTTKLALGNKEVEWEALVVNNLKLEAIIGMNLINKYKIKIDAENKTLRYGDEVIKWVQWKEENEGINLNNARLIKDIEKNEVQTNNVGDQEQVTFIKELVQKTQSIPTCNRRLQYVHRLEITDETPLKQNIEHPENEINILQQSEERIMVSRLKMKSRDMLEKRLKQIKENTYTAQDHKKTTTYNNEKAKHENNGKIETKGLIIEQIWKELDKIKVLENDIEKNQGDSEYEDKRRKKRRTHSEEDSIKCKLK